MKKGIHPKSNTTVQVTCACGNSFTTISTRDAISVEICSACHPFYTGKAKFVDTEGRIDKFNKKLAVIDQKKQATKTKKDNASKKPTDTQTPSQPSLKEMLEQARKSQ